MTGSNNHRFDFAALLKSSLARTLLAGFLLVAAVEAFFLAVLCIDVLNADRVASHEFAMLKGSQGLSVVIQKAQKVFEAADEARKNVGDPDKEESYHRCVNDTIGTMNLVIADLRKEGLDTKGGENLRSRFIQIADVMEEVMKDAKLTGDIKTTFRAVLTKSGDIYDEFVKEIKSIHKTLSGTGSMAAVALWGIDPQKLLYIALAINLALVLILLILVDKGISSPIVRLSKDCDRMISGELMPQPKRVTNEIGVLEQSFFEMSQVVCENEKRRHSFLEFFQSVQSAALENVRKCFDALLLESTLTDRAKKNIEKARGNLGTLIQLLQSMTEALTFNAATTINPEYQNCSSAELIAGAAAAVEALIQKRQIKLHISGKDYHCKLDPHLMSRVLVNFLSNAIKYSPDSGDVTVLVEDAAAGCIRVNVKDNGPGISKENQEKLFKEFSQVKSEDGVKRSGTGLGLVICKQIVEAHGGEVGIESEVGKGSCFWFSIPLNPPEKAKADETRKADSERRREGELQKDPQKKEKGRRSLKQTFTIMLVCLLIPQSLLVLKLHSMFGKAQQNAQSFSVEKEILMRVEEVLGLYLTWKLHVAKAVDSMQIADIAQTERIVNEEIENANWIVDNTSGLTQTNHEMRRVANGLIKLQKFGLYLGRHKDDLNLAAVSQLMTPARKVAKEVEKSLFDVLSLEGQGIKNSYADSQEMRSELLAAIGLAAAVNFILLAVVSVIGLGITERISVLKSKSEDFAAGKPLQPSLKGSDELAYLDKHLCEIAQAIKEADSQRQKLIAVINHDLRTPLSSIVNGLQMILAAGYGDIGQKERSLTLAAEDELNKLLQQINDLLLIEKIDAGLYQLSPEKFEVLPVLAATTRNFNASASKKGVRLRPEIPNECRNLCINGDKSLVEREFSIIIANAVEAAPKGSTIDVLLKKEGDAISVSFKDHGTGIDEELLPQIFDRFRFVGGKPITGLGLPLAQRLSAIHGGSLAIDSSTMGTETRVTLPLAV